MIVETDMAGNCGSSYGGKEIGPSLACFFICTKLANNCLTRVKISTLQPSTHLMEFMVRTLVKR
jgi:hypothetical protein